MVFVKSVVLDVLKPHVPNALEFSQAIAGVGSDYHVHLEVIEVDEKTETVRMAISGSAVDFESIKSIIASLGGSLHSIDEVEVQSGVDAE
jgi:hypothetical protein